MSLNGSNKHEVKNAYGWLFSLPTAQNSLVYMSRLDDDYHPAEIGVLDLDTGSRHQLAELVDPSDNIDDVFISPDGSIIGSQVDNYPDRNDITLYLFAADGSWSRVINLPDSSYPPPFWSSDSSKIVSNSNGIRVLTAQGEELNQIELPVGEFAFTSWNNCEIS
jgi:hypothetical protein